MSMADSLVSGTITGIGDDGTVTVVARVPDSMIEEYKRFGKVLMEFDDGRRVTLQQQRKAHVLLRYISQWSGYYPLEAAKEITKIMFMEDHITLRDGIFSLSNCDVTTARLYIDFLVDFCIVHNINIGQPMYELCEDVSKYVWACLMNKKCAVCGRPAELHHRDAIGMGRNRREIPQLGMAVLPLCRIHHSEAHTIGQTAFLHRYHLQTVKLTEEIGKRYRLTKKNLVARG